MVMLDQCPPGVLVGMIHLRVSESHTAGQSLMACFLRASQRSAHWTRGGCAQSWCCNSNGGCNELSSESPLENSREYGLFVGVTALGTELTRSS